MARGSKIKSDITKKILEVFPNSFLFNDGKEIRIPGIEDSEPIQIKVTLTAAKTNVNEGEDNIILDNNEINFEEQKTTIEVTQEEKDNVAKLLKSFGL